MIIVGTVICLTICGGEMCAQGELVVRLQPILDMVPVLGGIVMFFLDPPAVRLKFSGLAKVDAAAVQPQHSLFFSF
eukprot:1036733-Amphidinium_carterae.1